MKLFIFSKENLAVLDQIQEISLPAKSGRLQLLKNHAPLMSSMEAGEVRYRTDKNQKKSFLVEGGCLSVEKNEITLFVD